MEKLEAPEMEERFSAEDTVANVFSSILSLTTVNVECNFDCKIEYHHFLQNIELIALMSALA